MCYQKLAFSAVLQGSSSRSPVISKYLFSIDILHYFCFGSGARGVLAYQKVVSVSPRDGRIRSISAVSVIDSRQSATSQRNFTSVG
jgi:hypothetical protein